MAHSRSAEKRNRQTEKRTLKNRAVKSALRTAIKRTMEAIASGDAAKARAEFRVATQRLDKAAKVHTIHRNEAARRKSRIAKKIAALK
jgi:small subunit ribosomal protein S20